MILKSKENVWKDERLITSIWRNVLLCRGKMVKVGTQYAKY